MTSTPDDAELLARHVDGDRDAFTELVRRHRDRLWRIALRTLGNPEDAADALQDALLSAYRKAASFRGDAAVTTWLHRIVVNACLDLARRQSVRTAEPLDAATSASGLATDDEFGPREAAMDLLAALRTLPVEQAAALVLVDVEGYPVQDAAELLDVPVGTVKSRCARGRARLAAMLGQPRNPTVDVPVQPEDRGEEPS